MSGAGTSGRAPALSPAFQKHENPCPTYGVPKSLGADFPGNTKGPRLTAQATLFQPRCADV